MYPPAHGYEKRAGEHHIPPPFPASAPPQPYNAPPYIASGVQPYVVAGRWSTGLCHCCDDPANCKDLSSSPISLSSSLIPFWDLPIVFDSSGSARLITCFCPCITFGQIADIVSKGSSSCASSGTIYGLLGLTGLACLYSCFCRSKLRGQYDLDEAPCADCLVHFCCEPCALSQEYRELKNRGLDMGIGWKANLDRHSRMVIVAPVVAPGMTR